MKTPIANVEMAEAWDGDEGDDWAEDADKYEAATQRAWRRFVESSPVRAGDSVLDIGCGTGASSRELARAAGSVLGVDLSRRMLEVARARADALGLTNVDFVHADAQVHPFESMAYDVAVSVYGAMFFNDPTAAFANVHRALKPGGRLAMLAWQGLAANEWLQAVRAAFAVGRVLPAPPVGAPGPFGLADPDGVRAVLGGAGFTDVAFVSIEEPICFGSDADDAVAFFGRMGITRGLTAGLDEDSKAAAFAALRDALEAHATADGVLFGSASWLITASR